MTTQPSTRVTDTTARFWEDAGETMNALNLEVKALCEGDRVLNEQVTNHQEQPTAEEMAAQLHRALDVISAAQKHYYDVRRLHRHLVREAAETEQEEAA